MKDAASGKQSDPSEIVNMTRGMMKFYPIINIFIMVSLPGALALYYTTSNLIAVAQQHYLLKKMFGELDEISDEVIEQPTKKNNTKAAASALKKRAKRILHE